jgi:hypothetical protein
MSFVFFETFTQTKRCAPRPCRSSHCTVWQKVPDPRYWITRYRPAMICFSSTRKWVSDSRPEVSASKCTASGNSSTGAASRFLSSLSPKKTGSGFESKASGTVLGSIGSASKRRPGRVEVPGTGSASAGGAFCRARGGSCAASSAVAPNLERSARI